MKKIFLLIAVLFNYQSSAQDHIELFRSHIPDKILNDKNLSNTLDLYIGRNAILNPELIYLTLKFYQQYDSTNFNTQLFETVKENERIWLEKRNQWAAGLLEKIKSTGHQQLFNRIEYQLTQLHADINLKPSDKTVVLSPDEIMMRDFYIVKLYLDDHDYTFNDSQNYSTIRTQLEETRIQYFYDVQTNPSLISRTSDLIDDVIKNWYLLQKHPEIDIVGLLKTVNVDITENKTRKRLSFWVSSVLYNNTIHFTESIGFTSFDQKLNLDKKTSLSQFSLGVGYKFHIPQKSVLFSYIDVQAYYSRGLTGNDFEQSIFYSSSKLDGNFRIEEYLRSFENDYKLSALDSYGLKVSTPLAEFYLFTLEASCSFSLNSYLYTPDMHFIYSIYRTEYNDLGQAVSRETILSGAKKITDEKRISYFALIPSLDITMDLIADLSVKLSGGYNFAGVSVYYISNMLD